MLESLNQKKKYNISKKNWIKLYCNNKSLDTFTKDRIQLLYLIRTIKKNKNNISITANGYFVSFAYNFMKRNFFYD